MPELPEVETVKRILETQIIGKTIKKVNVFYDKLLENTDVETFKKELENEQICSLARKGKYLIIILEEHSLVVHLRMEGKFFIKQINDEIEKHEHVEFILDDVSLRYHDTRKFGKIALLKTTDLKEIDKYGPLKKIGLDAHVETDFVKVYNKIAYKKCTVKEALLDQSNVAGIGNIYADEVCFLSKLHPKTKCTELTVNDIRNILINSKTVLEKAILLGGTTIRSYTSSLGVTGRFQNSLLVHQRENKPCSVCNTNILKIKVGGRGTYYCPTCQKLRPHIKLVGVTGIIGSGKTTFTNILEEMGYYVIDCDVINREILMEGHPNYPTLSKIVSKHFPFCTDGKVINRRAIRDIIFNDEEKRQKFQSIIFGFIQYEIDIKLREYKATLTESEEKLVFLSAPLLFESGFYRKCDEIIVINCDYDTMMDRIMKRDNLTYDEAENAISLRSSFNSIVLKAKAVKKTPIIINNNGSIERLKKATNDVILKLKED